MAAPAPPPRRRFRPSAAQWTLAAIIVAFALGVVLYKALLGAGLGQSSAFYIGVPVILALLLTLSVPSGKAIGMTMKAITIMLLLSMPLLGEGFICVLIAAPLFYTVGLLVALLVQRFRDAEGNAHIVVLPAIALVLSLEGVTPALTLPTADTVSATRVVAAGPEAVAQALTRPLRFDDVAPTGVLALGFPRPVMDHGSGLDVGDRRVVMFDGAHHRPPVMAAHHWGEAQSQLEFEVVERSPGFVRLDVTSDTTPLATWLTWQWADISWREVDAGHTEITWTLRYDRELSPAWYFGPIEHVVAQRAANYLLNTIDLT